MTDRKGSDFETISGEANGGAVKRARPSTRLTGNGRLLKLMILMSFIFCGLGFLYFAISSGAQKQRSFTEQIDKNADALLEQGRQVFRYDTFGDEAFWGDTIKLHQAIQGEKLGGVGPGVSPKTALSVGLKVDAEALPPTLVEAIKKGEVDLDDPATTLALLKLNAVVGVKGNFNDNGRLRSMGISCALCHSTVDDSFAPGIGRRLDGWANRDLNVGAIVGLAPDLSAVNKFLGVDDATTRKVLASWGPGRFDALLFLDGKAFRPDGKTSATLIPPAYGLAGINNHGFTGFGTVTYWNAFVANLEMHGSGRFFDPRLRDPKRYPVAARNGSGDLNPSVDMVSGGLPSLHFYQLAIPAPKPPAGSYDIAAAARGEKVFMTGNGVTNCAKCHVPPTFSEPGFNMHTGKEIGIDEFAADRSPGRFVDGKEVGGYRTAPLKGLWAHQKGGFFHDGRFATLLDVVNHYNDHFKLKLTDRQKSDLVEYLKSL
ncbi:MAG: hypothetical protein IT174_04985 [Acidobacteria bacterium]|nr:hypothetical protein [Acidobacteriota bacterium]